MEKAMLFDLGMVVSTPGVLEAFQRTEEIPANYLVRHSSGDWGDVPEEDKQENTEAIQNGSRILSAYNLLDGTKFWIITDAEIDEQHHRQATTFLLPEEY